jgi:hypothetical protein
MLNLVTKYGDLDIAMIPNGTSGYDDLIVGAIRQQIGTTHATVASLDDVIRSKTAAGRPKDQRALPELLQLRSRHTAERIRLAVEQPGPPSETRHTETPGTPIGSRSAQRDRQGCAGQHERAERDCCVPGCPAGDDQPDPDDRAKREAREHAGKQHSPGHPRQFPVAGPPVR